MEERCEREYSAAAAAALRLVLPHWNHDDNTDRQGDKCVNGKQGPCSDLEEAPTPQASKTNAFRHAKDMEGRDPRTP